MTGRTVVIGGGAAGIAAARTLHDAGREVLLIEAADRLGGRAHSVRLPTGHVVDHGCGWLHSAKRNPWTRIGEQAGFTIDRRRPNWDGQWRDLGFPPEDQEAADAAFAGFETAALAAVDGPDRPLSDFVEANNHWRPMIEAVSGYVNGAALDQVSLHDWAAYEQTATDDNWAVVEGYGTVIVNHAAGLVVRTGITANRIDHRGGVLRIDTSDGTIECDHVVIAVPTSVLAAGKLIFDPPLPAKTDAAAALPLGIADKVFLLVEGPVPWPAHQHMTGNPHDSCTASHRLSPFGWPIIESFFGGPCAEALEEDGAAAAFAIDELVALLGSDWRRRFTPLDATRWRHVPLIGGSYSHARVGHASARQTLAEPVENRILFAGEACSREDFSTAHGAYQTGVDAAQWIMQPTPVS
ncbi:flavin monoamine oxidase family protein [Sphingomonas yabuuchiae]|uniref:Tryptophan 2-monooxygenase n=1 Tax=Sphingomonas yabuuchiae TaxID=172044 RepID=A0AA41DAS3_9SPHN|nr:NAD(P)/FAD-dependent oxidoreductase [Sphingomonas yabuuchiae]MBB4610412.1 monoamine oxidase [Sphingomonas yabuuchiae]MBN3558178.1 FAD-dependent oxidoreductase [Sphingomonas yabuuchiae]